MKPILGITMGDPAGIGPEILLKALKKHLLPNMARYVVFGDYAYLKKSFHFNFGKKIRFESLFSCLNLDELSTYRKNMHDKSIPIVDSQTLRRTPLWFGKATKKGGYASGLYIEGAVRATINNWIDGIVTLPINKEAFWMGGWGKKYPGHTEMLADLAGVRKYALMLICGPLKAIHVTSHIPIKDVPSKISRSRVMDTINLAIQGCRMLGIRKPKIAVCGLNPHAGDGGVLGREEQKIIAPIVRKFRGRNCLVQGPISADTVWPKVIEGLYDIGVAMYHDQGQIPLKLIGFNLHENKKTVVNGVNVTVGLPFVRTSVMHGTGFDIAGKGVASEKSFLEAVSMGIRLIKNFQTKLGI